MSGGAAGLRRVRAVAPRRDDGRGGPRRDAGAERRPAPPTRGAVAPTSRPARRALRRLGLARLPARAASRRTARPLASAAASARIQLGSDGSPRSRREAGLTEHALLVAGHPQGGGHGATAECWIAVARRACRPASRRCREGPRYDACSVVVDDERVPPHEAHWATACARGGKLTCAAASAATSCRCSRLVDLGRGRMMKLRLSLSSRASLLWGGRDIARPTAARGPCAPTCPAARARTPRASRATAASWLVRAPGAPTARWPASTTVPWASSATRGGRAALHPDRNSDHCAAELDGEIVTFGLGQPARLRDGGGGCPRPARDAALLDPPASARRVCCSGLRPYFGRGP